ncbi:MAG: calcium-binding protein [Pseudomonadota bacterium]
MASILFATTQSLGSYDLITRQTTYFGPVNTSDDPGGQITDVAGLADGRVFFSTAARLYEFDPGTGLTTQLGEHGRGGALVALGRSEGGGLLAGLNGDNELVELDPTFDPTTDQTFIRFMPSFFAGDVEAESGFFLVAPTSFDNREISIFDDVGSNALLTRDTEDEVIVGLAEIGGLNTIGVGDDGQVFSLSALAVQLDPIGLIGGLNGEPLVGAGYVGEANNDRFDVPAGSGEFALGAGDDTVTGSDEADQIFGGDGVDFIFAEGAADLVDGGAGSDSIEGGAGADRILGQNGRDTILGEGAGDVIEGGRGADVLAGGGGRDTIEGGGAADQIFGDNGRDVLDGQGGADVVDGDAGNDRIDGGGGDDELDGGAGRDMVEGGRGRDLLIGGAGRDQLLGGGGADVFFVLPGAGVDVVLDYKDGVDQLGFNGVRFKDLIVRQRGDDLLVRAPGGEAALVRDLDADDFTFRDVSLLT